jgi:hypothetical protein
MFNVSFCTATISLNGRGFSIWTVAYVFFCIVPCSAALSSAAAGFAVLL